MNKSNKLFAVIIGIVILGMVFAFTANPAGQTSIQTPTPPPPVPTEEAKVNSGANETSSATPPPSQQTQTKKENTMTNPSQPIEGLKKEILKEGTGQVAKSGDTVEVHYTGTLENGNKFDSSLDRGTPFSFPLGAGMVIKGWDEGVAGMKVGEKARLTIPASMGYGERGAPPVIPANATLIFEVELLAIK